MNAPDRSAQVPATLDWTLPASSFPRAIHLCKDCGNAIDFNNCAPQRRGFLCLPCEDACDGIQRGITRGIVAGFVIGLGMGAFLLAIIVTFSTPY